MPALSPPGAGAATILVVDDHAANRELLAYLLGSKGYRILEANDGAEALAAVREHLPDLVICDILMPTMDGFEFVRRLREDAALSATPVVFCSAHYHEREAQQLALACGITEVLTKPCEPQRVLDTVARTLSGFQRRNVLTDPGQFDRQHLRLVTDKLSRTTEHLRIASEKLAALVELNLDLASERDPDELLHSVCRRARQLIGARHAVLGAEAKSNGNGNSASAHLYASGFELKPELVFDTGSLRRGVLGEVMRNNRPYRVSGTGVEPERAGMPDGFPAFRSLVAAPITSLHQVYGWIGLADKDGNQSFDEEDEQLLSILGAQVGRIYENGSLYSKLQKNTLRLEIEVAERRRAEEEARENEAKYRLLIEQASDGIFVIDAAGRFILVNSRACELLGYREAELLGANHDLTYVGEEQAAPGTRIRQVQSGAVLRYERQVRRKDGRTFPAEFSSRMLDNGLIQVIFHDISERRAQEQKIARLSRIQSVLSGINSAIVRIRDRQELYEEACRIAVEHGGFSMGWIAVVNRNTGQLHPVAEAGLKLDIGVAKDSARSDGLLPAGASAIALREKRTAVDNDIGPEAARASDTAGPSTQDVRRVAVRLGAKSVVVLPIFLEGEIFGLLTLYAPETDFFDDEELKLLNELAGDISFGLEHISKSDKVDFLAYYDALTELPNRTLFFDRLGQALASAGREHSSLALVLVDLDRFRQINDTLGRAAGDALLTAVGMRLRETMRGEDTVARVGSNRFALVVSGISNSAEAAHAIEVRNRECFDRTFTLNGEELRVSATAGIAVFPNDADNAEALFNNAEAALRRAKSESVPFLFYGPEMNAQVAESMRMESRLRRAIELRQLELWYQPKVNLATGRLTGFEALMRWRDPDAGMVSPAKFIPMMEQTGLIQQAGRWAMAQVVRDCRRWAATGDTPGRIAVNVSPLQMRHRQFVADAVGATAEMEEAGSALDIEVTESVLMENVESIVPRLQTIAGLGVQIAVDDFGTGYSSLAYIARLPIHALKIDRSFVVDMVQSAQSLVIVKSIISLAHSLRLRVIAEGVETEEQAALLRELNCDEAQGFLFSKPVPQEEVSDLCRKFGG